MISALGYVYAPKNHVQTNQLLEKAPGEGRLFVQIFGKEPELMAQAAARLSALGRYEGVDINMGCPAHKVAASGEGSGLMRDPKKAEAIIHAVVGATDLPVSVKFRLGWDDASKNVEELAVMAEEQGVREIAVHGRTRQQQYSGKADWAAIGRVKRLVHIPVYGNGDIFTPQVRCVCWKRPAATACWWGGGHGQSMAVRADQGGASRRGAAGAGCERAGRHGAAAY